MNNHEWDILEELYNKLYADKNKWKKIFKYYKGKFTIEELKIKYREIKK